MATKNKNIRKATSHRNAIQKKLTEFVKRWKDESKEEFKNEMDRLSFLFERYAELTKEPC
ncbi:MAG: hypothetical protein Q9O24_02220 [Gammaproteobacteria bacterium]|nr:hypothetical protein [Gammaproteobacteria bacterium]